MKTKGEIDRLEAPPKDCRTNLRAVFQQSEASVMSMINVTLPDGTINEYATGITCAEVITDALGHKHGCLAATVDDVQVDMSHQLQSSCSVTGILSESEDGIHILRHSAAHLLAQAVTELYPGALPTIGPAIERGFYYDFKMEQSITEADLK